MRAYTRNGGDRIVDLVRQATGVDLLDAAVAIRSGQKLEPDTIDTPQAATVRFFMIEPGVIHSISGISAARTSPGVIDLQIHVSPGDRTSEINSSDDRAGLVVAIGATPEEASARADSAAATIQFTTS
ncbi:hypothetical protein [Rathayibacter tanaceti]|uniref:L-amino acid ligase C-terminal domain-containing protein n=1 Tax=Rathayibacter tanaceti TaxID=1671680 RepID=A0AAE6V5Q9_9MICO|nr:hypothetical protein [Rathayibacter tanaceti]QHC54784.1 hypothetical protein GSU10_03390 [Rathayibacter tanaceti]